LKYENLTIRQMAGFTTKLLIGKTEIVTAGIYRHPAVFHLIST
jgi:hypothetical protein